MGGKSHIGCFNSNDRGRGWRHVGIRRYDRRNLAFTSNYSGEGSGENVPTVSDSKSNTWTKVIDTYNVTNEVMSCLFYVNSTTPTVGSGHTFTVSCVAGFVAIFAFSGTFVSSPFGAYTTQENQSGNTSYQFASAITPTTSPSVIVSGLSTGGGSGGSSYSIDSGMTITATQNYTNGVSEGGAAAYLIQSVAASLQPTWTWGMTSPSSMLIASFNVAGSTGRSRIIQ